MNGLWLVLGGISAIGVGFSILLKTRTPRQSSTQPVPQPTHQPPTQLMPQPTPLPFSQTQPILQVQPQPIPQPSPQSPQPASILEEKIQPLSTIPTQVAQTFSQPPQPPQPPQTSHTPTQVAQPSQLPQPSQPTGGVDCLQLIQRAGAIKADIARLWEEVAAEETGYPLAELVYRDGVVYHRRNGRLVLNLSHWGGYRWIMGDVSTIYGCVNGVCEAHYDIMTKYFPYRLRYQALSSELKNVEEQLKRAKC